MHPDAEPKVGQFGDGREGRCGFIEHDGGGRAGYGGFERGKVSRRHGLLDVGQAERFEPGQHVGNLVHRPASVGVYGEIDPGPEGFAQCAQLCDVIFDGAVADPQLDLAVAALDIALGLRGQRARVGELEALVGFNPARKGTAQVFGERLSGAPGCPCPKAWCRSMSGQRGGLRAQIAATPVSPSAAFRQSMLSRMEMTAALTSDGVRPVRYSTFSRISPKPMVSPSRSTSR